MAKPIGTLGNIPIIIINGRTFVDIDNIFILAAYVATDGRFSTFRKPDGTGGYQVTSGKTFTVLALDPVAKAQFANNQSSIILLTSTAATTGFDQAAEPAGAVYAYGDATISAGAIGGSNTNLQYRNPALALKFAVAQNLFLNMKGNGGISTTWYAYGYEV